MFDAVKVKNDCVEWIRDWFEHNGPGCNAVIGISGGKDSSIVAALCVEALGKDRVVGVLMPNGVQDDIEDSIELVEYLGIPFTQVNILESYNGIIKNIGNMFMQQPDGSRKCKWIDISNQTIINIPPRIRMATLYAVSQSINGRVANTCNLSEDYIGYSTRWGDSVGDFAPLAHLTSDEVISVGEVCNLPYELTHKIPSDGLCGKTDEDNFGFSYAVLNKYIRTGVCEDEEVKEKIDSMHKKNLFKLMPMPSFHYNPFFE
jgi:NAD+ synthase